jgi:hypothetical protein
MILLNTPIPATLADLQSCLRNLLAQAITTTDRSVVASGSFPALDTLQIDVTRAVPLEHPAAQWSTAPGQTFSEFTVANLQITGQPFCSDVREVNIQASAADCRAQFVQTDTGPALRLAAAKAGKLRASITRASAEAAILAQAAQAAKPQGVDIQQIHLTWQTQGPRTLQAQIVIKAKKGFLPAANLKIKGQLQIDDTLTATISNLTVDGEGMVGSIGAGLIRPKLQQAEGTKKSLLSLPLDAIKITGVTLLATADALSVEATFEG